MNEVSRRVFVGGAVAAAVGAQVGRSATAAVRANNRIVVGVMGLSRGLALARDFARQENVELRYVCDVDRNRANSAASIVAKTTEQRPKPLQDFRQILDDKEVDVLVVATPDHWHAPATILACQAGKHVYVEKPCSHNPREGELMVQAARKYDRRVQMGTQRRSSSGTQEAIQRLREGVIGRVYFARCWYHNLRPSIGRGKPAPVPTNLDYDLWQGPAPRVPYYDNRIHYNWHWFWHWGTGELGNNGVHTIDLCRWGLGVDYPVRVTSSGGRYRYDDDQETPDTHTVAFEFPGERALTWQGLSCNKHSGGAKFVAFYGEKGALELDGNGTYRIYDAKDKLVEQKKCSDVGEMAHVRNLLDAIREGTPLNQEIEEGHKSTLLCHLGNIAHRTGRTLNCDPTSGHILNDDEAMKLWTRQYEPGWEPKV